MSTTDTPLRLDYSPADAALPRPLVRACQVGIAIIFGYLLIYHFLHERKDRLHLGDFPTFYQAAEFARDHKDIYLAGQNPQQMYVYPPLIAFLYTPLTSLSRLHAAEVMLVLTAAMLLGSLLLGARATLERMDSLRPGAVWVVAFLVSVLNEEQMRQEMTMLETDALMLLMFVVALWWLDRRPILAGVALAFALNVKYLTIVALPYLILRRRWKATAGMLVGSVGFALLPALLLGWDEDVRCLRVALGGLMPWVGGAPPQTHLIKVHNITDGLSVSITSALGRILGGYGYSNAKIMAVATAVGAVALAAVTVLYRRNGFSLWKWPTVLPQAWAPYKALVVLEWSGHITVAVAFSPDTNTRHLLLAILVNTAGAALLLLTPWGAVKRTPAIAGMLLISLGFIMPIRSLGRIYFRYSVPGWCLLAGYLLILWTGLQLIQPRSGESQ